jgi:peptide-methionine (S)-S-oxide reductase
MSPDAEAMENPTYQQVCSGSTGHVEVLYVELTDSNSNEETFEQLIRFFFQFHDPTTKDRQGNDSGSQYSSVIFCNDKKQHEIATKVKQQLQDLMNTGTLKKNAYNGASIETTIVSPLNPFYPAHDSHQQYLEKNPLGYCNHYYRFKEWPSSTCTPSLN